jgi:ABC-type uncharacterized transport system involved in gliding motility auxiliary subunit
MERSKSVFGRLGLVAIAVIFIIAVSLSNLLFRGLRLDLTENQLFTLSDGTIRVLENISEPINLYFFFSDRATADTPVLRIYAVRVREMLQEFVQHSDGKLRLSMIDPIPFSEDEDRAAEFGLQGISLGITTEPIYMGIAGTNSIGDEEIISFLDPGKETFLEYDLAKLIDTLSNPERPVVGLLSDLPLNGGFDPVTQRMADPWLVVSQIRQLFDVRELPVTTTGIDEDVSILLVAHPKTLTPATQYAIDQFILRGGNALLFVDPYAEADMPAPDPNNPAAAMMASRASVFDALLDAWGVKIDTSKFIGDDRFALTISGVGNRPVRHLGLIGVDNSGMAEDDVVTSGLRSLNFGYAGHIAVADNAAATVMPLVQSSEASALLSSSILNFLRDPEQLRVDFVPTGKRYTIAARIQGIVPTAFPDGTPEESDAEHLAESVAPINVILVADTDLLTDRLWAQIQNFFGQRIPTAFADNANFVINALDNLSGSGDLISIRSRATYARPFTRVQELQRDAEGRYRVTEERLEQELEETERRLSELQASREDSSALILTTEQEAALEKFQEQRLRIRKELRQVQRNLDQQIEDLGTWLKIINIGLAPLLITLLSIAYLLLRRRKARL